ncbi:hypothetical protein A464_1050 [Salmonella bongori N268-08]|uniref:Uncharacterized protein n=1 Tax=Salmonella bongori N268-08 TaxID=1197719 RepID=S5MNJ3_SALBN|nr:hypothetical protein A464_1050 [Salmonella bongori N268-08]
MHILFPKLSYYLFEYFWLNQMGKRIPDTQKDNCTFLV